MPTYSGALSADPLAEEKARAALTNNAESQLDRRITAAPQQNQAAAISPSSDGYTTKDISSELWREVELSGGLVIRIDNPLQLIMRNGGSTHRVVDAQGVVHCYPAPETGKSVIRWKSRLGYAPVCF